MTRYPVEIRRCRHIKTNGTLCGSPALKEKELCFYHEQNRPQPAELYLDGERYCDGQIMLPVFEDAHSIQTVIRQVVKLMLSRRIERKDAGLLLYALQIASGNLKTMQAEKARPTHVVVDPDTAGETPLGMTPWSASGQGHDPEEEDAEEDAEEQHEAPSSPEHQVDLDNPSPHDLVNLLTADQRKELCDSFREKELITKTEFEEYLTSKGRNPLVLAAWRLLKRKRSSQSEADLPPGTIQACRGEMRAHTSHRTRCVGHPAPSPVFLFPVFPIWESRALPFSTSLSASEPVLLDFG